MSREGNGKRGRPVDYTLINPKFWPKMQESEKTDACNSNNDTTEHSAPNKPDDIKLLMNHDLLKKAIDKWGYDRQMYKAIEECAELIKAICKYDVENVLEECADVLIMCEQIKIMFGAEKVEEMIEYKLKRLEVRLK